jgi:chorismate mutase
MKKYPKIKRIGDSVNNGILESGYLYVQEKLDGANFRFTYDEEEDRIVFGSRNVEYWNEKDTDKAFEHAVEYIREQVDKEKMRDLGDLVFFGEAMHEHTLDYDWESVPSFIGFDVYDQEEDVFWTPAEMELSFDALNLPTAPVVYDGIHESYNNVEVPESVYRDGVAEGIVIKNIDTGQQAKVRSKDFKEKHGGQSVSNPDEYEPDDSVVLARDFTTEARVLKMIHKYEDRGRDIEMSIMEDLWRDIFEDIIEEEFETIFLGNYNIDTKQFRSEVASITADVLQSYLSRPDGSVLNQPA